MFKKVLRGTQGLEVFYVGLLGFFSRRFRAGKQVGAQSGCGGWRPADRQVVGQSGFLGGVDLLIGKLWLRSVLVVLTC